MTISPLWRKTISRINNTKVTSYGTSIYAIDGSKHCGFIECVNKKMFVKIITCGKTRDAFTVSFTKGKQGGALVRRMKTHVEKILREQVWIDALEYSLNADLLSIAESVSPLKINKLREKLAMHSEQQQVGNIQQKDKGSSHL